MVYLAPCDNFLSLMQIEKNIDDVNKMTLERVRIIMSWLRTHHD